MAGFALLRPSSMKAYPMKSDIQLQKDILAELVWDPAVNATDVGVIVRDGVVTLTGQLTNFAEKYAAERAARRVSGVKALAVEIEVRLTPSHKRSDTDIAAAARQALDASVAIPANAIQPEVEKGWLTLNGEVEWDFQRKAAEQQVRDLIGVVGVTNRIKVKTKVVCTDVKQGIHDALVRQAKRRPSTCKSWSRVRASPCAARFTHGMNCVRHKARPGRLQAFPAWSLI